MLVPLKIVSNVSRFKPALNLNRVLADLNRGLNSLNSTSDPQNILGYTKNNIFIKGRTEDEVTQERRDEESGTEERGMVERRRDDEREEDERRRDEERGEEYPRKLYCNSFILYILLLFLTSLGPGMILGNNKPCR